MSQLEVDKIIPQSGTTLTIGDSGDTISFAEGTNLGIDTNTLVIDSTNNRVGIKNASPTVELDVTGSVAVSGTVTATSFSGDGSSLTGITSVGGATGVSFNDNVKAQFGASNDLQIYHDGSHSYIKEAGAGNLYISGSDYIVLEDSAGQDYMYAKVNDTVSLNFNGSEKFKTTSTGVDVTGTVTADGLTVDTDTLYVDATNNLVGINTSSPSSFNSQARNLVVGSGSGDAGMTIYTGSASGDTGNIFFADGSSGSDPVRGGITYDHGANQLKFRVNDANRMEIDSSGNVGIGTSSPTFSAGTGLHVNSSGTDCRIHITNSNTGTTSNDGSYIVAGSDGALNILNAENAVTRFYTNATARMQISASGHLLPEATNTYDLGATGSVWRNIYTSDFHMSNEGLDKGNDIDGTKGSWTFQEGEENLYLINNKNGKKYKFNLTEIE